MYELIEQKVVAKKLIQLNPTGPVFQKCVETARECSKTVQNTADRVKCSYGKIFQPVYLDPGWKNRDLGNLASPPSHMDVSKILQRLQG